VAVALVLTASNCGKGPSEAPRGADPARVEAQGPLKPAPSSAELFQAAFDGNLSTVDLALARGAEVDSVNPEGSTILMLAAFNGHTDVVRALLDRGASIDRRDLTGRTALMYASSGPYADTVGLLIEKGASVNLTDHGEGWSALMFAGGEGQVEVIRTLLAHGADAELVDEDGETALTFAQRNGHADAASLLQAAMKE
jgi:ankyrin repeat protein